MKSRNQLYIFIAVWLVIFMVCSVLSGVAYSVEETSPAKKDPQATVADQNTNKNPNPPPTTTDPNQKPTDEPPVDTSPYSELTYSADNAQYLIFIDAGHGWFDNGSSVKVNENGEYDENGEYIFEKDINLVLSKKLKQALEKMGYTVGETRPGDENSDCPVPLVNGIFYAKDRPSYVNGQGADYFVSIHCNSFDQPTAHGTRIFYSDTRDVNLKLASAIGDALTAQMGETATLHVDRQLYILLYSSMPTVLIESSFITNPDDLANLLNPDWQDRFVCGIAKGIDANLHAQNAG